MADHTEANLDGRLDSRLMGRLGHELGLLYLDTLQAPLPAGFQRLIDRLDHALAHGSETDRPARR